MKGGKVMKKNILILSLFLIPCSLFLTSCKDYLTELSPGTNPASTFFGSTAAAKQAAIGCYVPLMWEYNGTYLSEWFIGDIVSDDALKGGGSTNDMADAYDMENWKTESTNGLLLQFYRGQFQGIGRCNLAIQNIEKMAVGTDKDFSQSMKNRLLAEAHYLRAYYYFRLVRVFGGVPMTTTVIDEESAWQRPRASVADVFAQIISDLEFANNYLPLKSKMAKEDLGRATKGAAQAMLMKVNLYMASPYWKAQVPADVDYALQAKLYGDTIIASGEYDLCDEYWDNFTLAGENGIESVFEIQYKEVPWGDYGEGFGYTAGSFTQILTRSRSSMLGGGWGFNHPTWNLYNEFEEADTLRRDAAIMNPEDPKIITQVQDLIIAAKQDADQHFIDSIRENVTTIIENPSEELYLDNALLNNKYGMYYEDVATGGGMGKWGAHASRGPLNNKQIRYADVLLMHAEACLLAGGYEAEALEDINKVRARAQIDELDAITEEALRHERRCELAMEGHRWFDLVRWGNTKQHMDAYAATEPEEVTQHMAAFVEGKHELFPIPSEERILNPQMSQNNGY